jgi:uncharacterized protein
VTALARRVDVLDWNALARDLDAQGYALTDTVLTPDECKQLAARYDDDAQFRSVVDMQRHNFGSGEYKYFAYPLPAAVAELRTALYAPLRDVANEWAARLRTGVTFPPALEEFLEACHRAGQTRPTPLLLHYRAGDYNALHQDVYGDLGFPLQVLSVLSPADAYDGGEVLLVTQRPRAQSVGEAITPHQGQLLVFPNQYRPVAGTRGDHRVQVRHGVSRLRAGERCTLGLIFHDAR